jgi:hypothetical protein
MMAGNHTMHGGVLLKGGDLLVEMGRSIKKLNRFIRQGSVNRKRHHMLVCADMKQGTALYCSEV